MGGGSWTAKAFSDYTVTAHACTIDSLTGAVDYSTRSTQEIYKSKRLDPALDPRNVIRECCDSEEHPNTVPVILALDVTGSMGEAAKEVAGKLNVIMTELFKKVKDVEFMIMGIGDLAYDKGPIQASQFESDIRIAEQLDKLWFEFGGGGNSFESYTAAWYFGLHHTKLDCWNRGKRGIIITMGDEQLNPYLPINAYYCGLMNATGDVLQADVETKDLYPEVIKKFDVYHLNVDHRSWNMAGIATSWKQYLDDQHYRDVNLNNIADTIVDIIVGAANENDFIVSTPAVNVDENGEIAW